MSKQYYYLSSTVGFHKFDTPTNFQHYLSTDQENDIFAIKKDDSFRKTFPKKND